MKPVPLSTPSGQVYTNAQGHQIAYVLLDRTKCMKCARWDGGGTCKVDTCVNYSMFKRIRAPRIMTPRDGLLHNIKKMLRNVSMAKLQEIETDLIEHTKETAI